MKMLNNNYGVVKILALLPDSQIFCETDSDYVVWSYSQKADLSLDCFWGHYYPKDKYTLESATKQVMEEFSTLFMSELPDDLLVPQ